MRIVSLTCSNTEIVCALGCGDMLVGVDDHSDFPVEIVSRLPRVGPDLGIDIGKVAALRPDLVLASLTVPGHEKIVAGLAAAGLPWMAPEPVSLADVYRNIQDIAARLGCPERGATWVNAMQEAMPDMSCESGAVRPAIAVEWWPKPVIVPGRRSWVTDLIQLAGAVNPWGADDVKSRPIDNSELAAVNPDVMVISWCGVEPGKYRPEVVSRRPELAQSKAVLGNAIACIPEAFMGRPGPRLVDGYRALRRLVRQWQGNSAGAASV